ncbi:MAG: stage II sporulation protein M [Vicinamibacterales bacterium]
MPTLGISARWVDRRKPSWNRLEVLIAASGARGVSILPHADLRELAVLYRQTAADLSVVRGDPASAPLARYLNGLVGRAHNLIYAGGTPRARGIWHFYARVFPRIFRQSFPYTLTAAALFVAGLIAGTMMAVTAPSLERVLLGGAMLDTIERGQMWTHSLVAVKPVASSAIMTNNLTVSFGAFAGGLAAGLGTVYMMLLNGVLLGVVAVACARAGLALQLWSFIAPHGALELPAIMIAGGAGLMLAKGLLAPGTMTRMDGLRDAAATAVQLVLGVVPLLIIAGTIEGFVSPSDIPIAAKFAIGAAAFVLLVSYVSLAARADDGDSVSQTAVA